MPFALHFFLQHAYTILFFWVLVEQLGVPLPSTPILLAAGTLTATRQLALPAVVIVALAGSLISDSLWYWMGKRYGGLMVRLLCRLSFESTVCVRKTEEYFTRRGPASLLVSKFIPGLGTVAAPIAGQTGMSFRRFVFFDAGGILLWTLSVVLGGHFFGDILRRHPNALSWTGHFALGLFLLVFVGFLAWRFFKQRMFLAEIRMARIFPDELKARLEEGEEVIIVDLRHPLDLLPDPRTLPGALRLTPDKLMAQLQQIPRDREVVLFCTCPSEATAAKTALQLRRAGIQRVRPLYGGFDEWKKRGYPLVEGNADLALEYARG
jgi:membrane protein DedA with SNARE-associated domain/rhodanese-related sulfurtransferase